MSTILKFFRRIHHTTPAFSKEDLNDDRDTRSMSPIKVQSQKNHRFLRQSSVDVNYTTNKQTSQNHHSNGEKKVKFKIRKNPLDPSSNDNSSPSEHEFKTSFRAKLFISPNINRFKRFHSLNNENVEENECETTSMDMNKFNAENLVFERVKVKKNTRYLRHSPDRSSVGSSASSVDTKPGYLEENQRSSGVNAHISNGNKFDRQDQTSSNNNESSNTPAKWTSNNASARRLWDVNKNSEDDINNNNWDDDFEITLRSSVSPLPSSISSSSTMDTWVDDESTSISIATNDWVDDRRSVDDRFN